jgi:hypothetical protein
MSQYGFQYHPGPSQYEPPPTKDRSAPIACSPRLRIQTEDCSRRTADLAPLGLGVEMRGFEWRPAPIADLSPDSRCDRWPGRWLSPSNTRTWRASASKLYSPSLSKRAEAPFNITRRLLSLKISVTSTIARPCRSSTRVSPRLGEINRSELLSPSLRKTPGSEQHFRPALARSRAPDWAAS